MKIMMLKSAFGITSQDGSTTQRFLAGNEYEATTDWEMNVLKGFVSSGLANNIQGNVAVPETKKVTKKTYKKKAK